MQYPSRLPNGSQEALHAASGRFSASMYYVCTGALALVKQPSFYSTIILQSRVSRSCCLPGNQYMVLGEGQEFNPLSRALKKQFRARSRDPKAKTDSRRTVALILHGQASECRQGIFRLLPPNDSDESPMRGSINLSCEGSYAKLCGILQEGLSGTNCLKTGVELVGSI